MEHHPFYSVRPILPVYPEPKISLSARINWILVRDNSVMFLNNQKPGTILMSHPIPAGMISGEPVYLGIQEDQIMYGAELSPQAAVPDCWELSKVRELAGKVPDNEVALAAYAARILDFDRSSTFCGMCGGKTRPLTTERARICCSCNRIIYPRISPAIIVLIKKGEEVLLARSPGSPPNFFSVIAGFNEPGENLEQTVHREIFEEVGLMVQNVKYFGSEPWPFPDSLMIGFSADYAQGEIRIDNQEIEEARWFTRDNMPLFPFKASISKALIEAWIRREI